MILNLRSLSQAVSYHHFKVNNLQSAINLMTPNCHMASLDLKDAYCSVAVAEPCQCVLKFRQRRQTYVYVCLPSCLASALAHFHQNHESINLFGFEATGPSSLRI